MESLKVSPDGRFITEAPSGAHFFYLADTAWELLHRLSREDTAYYLDSRAAAGFTVIHTVVLAEHEFERGNAYGHLPLIDNDPTRPNEDYFAHVDWVARYANAVGLRLGILPTWGDKWNLKWGAGPEIFTPENARWYGEYIGRRYRDCEVVWILGGDREIQTAEHAAIIRSLAQGVQTGDDGRHLITVHPEGQQSSAQFFHSDTWLDFNMWQTGHDRNLGNYYSIASDYQRTPPKPVMDAESGYEDHIAGYNIAKGRLNDYDIRKAAYWAVFAGGCGHVYGCDSMWQFFGEPWKPVYAPRIKWRDALNLPGALQMRHLRSLIESRSPLKRLPCPGFVVSDRGVGTHHVEAMRAADGSYAYVYSASGNAFAIDSSVLGPGKFRFSWYDPRAGAYSDSTPMKQQTVHEFTPPSHGDGCDWVLVIDRNEPS